MNRLNIELDRIKYTLSLPYLKTPNHNELINYGRTS